MSDTTSKAPTTAKTTTGSGGNTTTTTTTTNITNNNNTTYVTNNNGSNSESGSFLLRMLFGATDMLPGLLLNIPELAGGMISQSAGPVAGQLVSGLIRTGYGKLLNALTGTGDSDLRASDLLGNATTYSINQSIQRNKAAREIYKFDTSYLDRNADDLVTAVMRGIYGDDHEKHKDKPMYQMLRSAILETRRQSVDISKDVVGYMAGAGERVSYGGSTFELGSAGENENAKKFAAALTKKIDEMTFGGPGKNGKNIPGITGALSKAEITQAIQDAARYGVFRNDDGMHALERYVKQVAEGMQYMKGALGVNTTLAQARQTMTALYGTDVYKLSPELFASVARDLNQLLGSTGVTATDIVGDQKNGVPGTFAVISALSQGTGIGSGRQMSLSRLLAALSKDQHSGTWASTQEFQVMLGKQLVINESTGANTNLAVLLQHWAENKGKTATELSQGDYKEFREYLTRENINWKNTTDVANRVGVQYYQGVVLSGWGRSIAESNSVLYAQLTAADADKTRQELRDTYFADDKVRAVLTEAELSVDDLGKFSQQYIAKKLFTSKHKDKLSAITAFARYSEALKIWGLSWMDTPENFGKEVSVVSTGAQGMQGVAQLLARNPQASWQELAAAFLGVSVTQPKKGKDGDKGLLAELAKNEEAVKAIAEQTGDTVDKVKKKLNAGEVNGEDIRKTFTWQSGQFVSAGKTVSRQVSEAAQVTVDIASEALAPLLDRLDNFIQVCESLMHKIAGVAADPARYEVHG